MNPRLVSFLLDNDPLLTGLPLLFQAVDASRDLGEPVFDHVL